MHDPRKCLFLLAGTQAQAQEGPQGPQARKQKAEGAWFRDVASLP